MSVTVRAPAKINLHLGVGAPRGDGFHPLLTVYQAVGLEDELTATPAEDWSVTTSVADWMDAAVLPPTEGNIVTRAARRLAAHHGVPVTGAVHVVKQIPVAGGMAGGSADAAAALVALDRLWGTATPEADLLSLAAELGSDVPFALLGGSALGIGRGELVEPVADAGRWWWVVVPSHHGLSTPAVYGHFDDLRPGAPAEPASAEELLGALADGDPRRLAKALHNDLQVPAVDLRPELGDLIGRGEAAGALRGLVSGSGPTCVFLCESETSARAVAEALDDGGHPAVLLAGGAVPGPLRVRHG